MKFQKNKKEKFHIYKSKIFIFPKRKKVVRKNKILYKTNTTTKF